MSKYLTNLLFIGGVVLICWELPLITLLGALAVTGALALDRHGTHPRRS